MNIRQERMDNEWTLKHVGDNVGVTKATVHDVETGRCNPSVSVLVKLSRLFNKCPLYLLAQANGDEKHGYCKMLPYLLYQVEAKDDSKLSGK